MNEFVRITTLVPTIQCKPNLFLENRYIKMPNMQTLTCALLTPSLQDKCYSLMTFK